MAIILTGITSADPVPGDYLEISWAQGESSGGATGRPIVVLANRSTAGSATTNTRIYGPDTDVQLATEQQMIALAGPGSEAHRIFRRMVRRNQTTAIYWCFVAESAGANATGTIVLTSTATGAGNLRAWVHDEFVDVPIANGDTPTVIGDALEDAINAMTHWGVTASNTTGTVTLTAKQKGPRGNLIRYMAAVSSGITTSVSATTDTALSGGTTADSNTAALATLLPRRFYYTVPAAVDSVQLAALCSQVALQALPATGIRQRVVAGSVDTISNAIAVTTALNQARAEVVWLKNSTWTPGELAGACAALYALKEGTSAADLSQFTNFALFGQDAKSQDLWGVPAPRDESAYPTRADLVSALNSGLSPIAVSTGGRTFLVNRVTTRFLQGATSDFRIRPPHKVTVNDYFADDWLRLLGERYRGKRIADDPPRGARPPGPAVVTPQQARVTLFGLLDDYDALDLWDDVARIKAGTVVERQTSPTTRLGVRIPTRVADNLEQTVTAIDQVF